MVFNIVILRLIFRKLWNDRLKRTFDFINPSHEWLNVVYLNDISNQLFVCGFFSFDLRFNGIFSIEYFVGVYQFHLLTHFFYISWILYLVSMFFRLIIWKFAKEIANFSRNYNNVCYAFIFFFFIFVVKRCIEKQLNHRQWWITICVHDMMIMIIYKRMRKKINKQTFSQQLWKIDWFEPFQAQ